MAQKKTAPEIRPFLKWAGNKFRIVPRIRKLLPAGRRLVEPFAGSGALFLNSDFESYLLCDSNADLINLYQAVQQEGEDFVDYCEQFFRPRNNQEKAYYRLRDEFNRCNEPRLRSALFLYLNRHGYNGLCRYNAKGGFNVPFGRYKNPYFPAEEMLTFNARAQRAVFEHADYTTTMRKARPGDVIYCDPPYVPLSPSANFTSYAAGGFDLEQQQALADLAWESAARGVPVLISNHNTPFTRKAYRGAMIKRFQVQRYISCNGTNRGKAGELLALFAES
jgi:DNA adenine methylase